MKIQSPNMSWFFPSSNDRPVYDNNLNEIGVVPNPAGLNRRLVDLVANTSRICTSARSQVEQMNARY